MRVLVDRRRTVCFGFTCSCAPCDRPGAARPSRAFPAISFHMQETARAPGRVDPSRDRIWPHRVATTLSATRLKAQDNRAQQAEGEAGAYMFHVGSVAEAEDARKPIIAQSVVRHWYMFRTAEAKSMNSRPNSFWRWDALPSIRFAVFITTATLSAEHDQSASR